MSKKVELSAEERAQLVLRLLRKGGTRDEYRAGAFPSRRYTAGARSSSVPITRASAFARSAGLAPPASPPPIPTLTLTLALEPPLRIIKRLMRLLTRQGLSH